MKKKYNIGFKNLLLFMLVITIGFASLSVIHYSFNRLSHNLDQNLKNKDMEITIGRYILNHLQTIEVQFYQIALRKDSNYLEVIKKDITEEIEHLKKSFITLQEGGTILHKINLNVVNVDDYEEILVYQPTDYREYSLESIDINPKLDQTFDKLNELSDLIKEYEFIKENGNDLDKISFDNKFSNYMKYIPPYFFGMKANARRIIYQSKIQADVYRDNIFHKQKIISLIEIGITLGVILIIPFLGYRSGKQFLDLNARLADYANKADKANIAKTIFVTNMSHEIRTPLNAIIGFSEILDQSSRVRAGSLATSQSSSNRT